MMAGKDGAEMRYPLFRPVAERGMLVEFGAAIDDAVHAQVLRLDRALAARPFPGFREATPAYASLLVSFDPLVSDHHAARRALEALIAAGGGDAAHGALRHVGVCYEPPFAPDLAAVAKAAGMTEDDVINAHLQGDYRVYMYGFAPGYAYLAGVPEAIRMPRKDAPLRGVAAGSVIIAGPQCLVTTLTMPTGWWIIGRSPTPILDLASPARPFLFDVGDRVRFRRLSLAEMERESLP